jgi:hypothetical protein
MNTATLYPIATCLWLVFFLYWARHLAVENPSGLDAAREAAQENRLPHFDRKDSALRILAKE